MSHAACLTDHPPAPLGQGLDTRQDVPTPKVVEALLGTRFCGRQAGRVPLVGLGGLGEVQYAGGCKASLHWPLFLNAADGRSRRTASL